MQRLIATRLIEWLQTFVFSVMRSSDTRDVMTV